VSDLRQLRHDLRGAANTLILCAASLRYANRQEQLEFLDDIEKAAEKCVETLDSLEAMPEHFEHGADDPQ
jgi:hypothetical protein